MALFKRRAPAPTPTQPQSPSADKYAFNLGSRMFDLDLANLLLRRKVEETEEQLRLMTEGRDALAEQLARTLFEAGDDGPQPRMNKRAREVLARCVHPANRPPEDREAAERIWVDLWSAVHADDDCRDRIDEGDAPASRRNPPYQAPRMTVSPKSRLAGEQR